MSTTNKFIYNFTSNFSNRFLSKIRSIIYTCFELKDYINPDTKRLVYIKTNGIDYDVLFNMTVDDTKLQSKNTITLWSICSATKNKGYLGEAIKELTSRYANDVIVRLIASNSNFNITFNDRIEIYTNLGFTREVSNDKQIKENGGQWMRSTIFELKIMLLKKCLFKHVSYIHSQYKKLQILRPENTDFIDYKISTKKNNDTIDILREYEKINSLLFRIIKN
jgi:hypothetical protein